MPGIEPAEKGWAAEVDVAAGASWGRGLVAVLVLADTSCAASDVDCVKGRELERVALRRALRRRRQRRQIIVGEDDVGGWMRRCGKSEGEFQCMVRRSCGVSSNQIPPPLMQIPALPPKTFVSWRTSRVALGIIENNKTPFETDLYLPNQPIYSAFTTTKQRGGKAKHRVSSQQPYRAINKKINSATTQQQARPFRPEQ